ncbi:MAG TPA: ATP-binding protein [Bacteroidales bacterium]|nr:ATP-binding protein [Bacteroidales bacterium]
MKKKYWIVSVLILLGICAYLFNYFYQVERKRKIEEILSHQRIHARQAARSFTGLFEKWNSVLYYMANNENIITLNKAGRAQMTQLIDLLRNEIKGVTRTDTTGRIIFTVPDTTLNGSDISYQKHVKKILTDHKPSVSDVFTTVQGFSAIVIHYPVFKNHQFAGTIALVLDFEKISREILDEVKIGKTGTAWMVSKEGAELYCPVTSHMGKSIKETSFDCPSYLPEIDSMLAGKEGTSLEFYAKNESADSGKRKIVYYVPVYFGNTYWSLAVSYSEDEVTSSLADFRNKLALVFLIVFGGGVVLSYYGIKAFGIIKESALRQKAEEDLLKERTLLRTLIDNLPSGVFIKDSNYRKVIVNSIHANSLKGHLMSTGKDPETNIIGTTDFDVFPKEDAEKFYVDDSKVLEQGISIINKVEEGLGPDGEKIWLLISKVPIKDQNGEIIGMVGITTDITSRKKAEEELIIAKEKAEESDNLKTAFLNNISHEIRTPLNAVIGFAGLLKEPDVSESQVQNYANIIMESSNQLLLIITDIINISTIEAGQVKVNWSEVDINSTINILYEQHRSRAENKNLRFFYSAPLKQKAAVIISDYTKFIEVLSNLISNAIKFTENGHVSFGYELKDNFLEFYVEDTGIGIDPNFSKSIFDRFTQAESAFSHKYGGAGLGLSISKAYVEVLGGSIWFNSLEGEGTTFYFTIPYKPAVEIHY